MCEYPVTKRSAGDEISSTYEGRHLTFLESELTHPYHADGLVDKGDPVLVGDNIVGIAMNSAAAATDKIVIDTEGIWALYVLGCVSDGTSDGIALAMDYGDPVFIKRVPGTDQYILSGQQDPYHFQPFGEVLGAVTASTTSPTLVAVKVHKSCVPLGGILHFGSGSAAAGNFLLEGSTTTRQAKLIEACIAPATILLAGEQIHGINMRIVDNLISTGGEITCAEFKAVRDEATDASVSAATALKLNVDNKNGGIAPYCRALDIMVEGAPGTTPAIRSAIHINSGGTAGTLEGVLEIEAGAFGCKTVTTNPSDTGTCMQIPIIYGGTVYYLLGYNATGS
ncbi:MAG: hypothetical protein WC683_07495 [bacterium]